MTLKKALALPLLLSAVAAISACSTAPAHADEPGRHPAYLHALSDLRAANWMLEHRRPEDGAIADDELIARDEIGAAFNEIKRAAIYDGKDIRFHPETDVALPRDGRLHKAVDLLRKVHNDIAREEDDPGTRGLQHRALEHVDAALHASEHAIGEVRKHDRMKE
ncbi:hypothetical protein [Undibacterium sp.]|uniref:hypothetical protein n=1 Tax=Undibacterium sp. TaxID=1914977 RepID=UPI00374CEB18